MAWSMSNYFPAEPVPPWTINSHGKRHRTAAVPFPLTLPNPVRAYSDGQPGLHALGLCSTVNSVFRSAPRLPPTLAN